MANKLILEGHNNNETLNIDTGGKRFIRLGSGEIFEYIETKIGTAEHIDLYRQLDLDANTLSLDWLRTAAQEI